MEKIYGRHYSSSAISNTTTTFYERMRQWRGLWTYNLTVFIDVIQIKIRRDRVSSEAFYVLFGVKEGNTREVIRVINIPNELASGWRDALDSIRRRSVEKIIFIVSDSLPRLDTSYLWSSRIPITKNA